VAKASTPDKLTVRARIVLIAPPAGVAFAMQRDRYELEGVTVSTGADLHFDFTFQVSRGPTGAVRFFGEFVQGKPGSKFVYVNSGTSAGQFGSCWTRRAKIGLESATWAMLQRVARNEGARLEGSINGTGRDGGPSCATVPLLGSGWMAVSHCDTH
jgi:hypothetical protein